MTRALAVFVMVATMFLAACSPAEEPLIGGDKDEHGCLIAAGYSWCEAKQKCLRTWEEPCETNTDYTDYCDDEDVAGVYACGEYVQVVSSLLGGGSTYYYWADGSSINCPVVGPDYVSEECRSLAGLECGEDLCS